MLTVNIKDTVRFKHLPPEFFDVWETIWQAADRQGKLATITGAAYEKYKKGSYHDKGYAWDVRTYDIPDPFAYACLIASILRGIDNRYRVVYGDANHTDHIHIEYRYDLKTKAK